eukprot:TRINITY_DN3627_c0_g1_i1.p1 TRINITY_DN3627_c0_g1~~TRINITY_DN3627_c0_g1_i1.p1  ORF type:complete len:929 (+),score=197.55 TRINITY_DN3627_c0_g1_i1:35-2788(+)
MKPSVVTSWKVTSGSGSPSSPAAVSVKYSTVTLPEVSFNAGRTLLPTRSDDEDSLANNFKLRLLYTEEEVIIKPLVFETKVIPSIKIQPTPPIQIQSLSLKSPRLEEVKPNSPSLLDLAFYNTEEIIITPRSDSSSPSSLSSSPSPSPRPSDYSDSSPGNFDQFYFDETSLIEPYKVLLPSPKATRRPTTLPSHNQLLEESQEDSPVDSPLQIHEEVPVPPETPDVLQTDEMKITEPEPKAVPVEVPIEEPKEFEQVIIFALSSPYVDLRDYGPKVFVVGSVKELGHWECIDDTRMWEEEETLWSLDVRFENVREGQVIEYKYAILDDDDHIRLEKLSEPRKLVVGPYQEEQEAIRLTDEWEIQQKSEQELNLLREKDNLLKQEILRDHAKKFLALRQDIVDSPLPRPPEYHNGHGMEEENELKVPNPMLSRLKRTRSRSSPFQLLMDLNTSKPITFSHLPQTTLLRYPEKEVQIPYPERSLLSTAAIFSSGSHLPDLTTLTEHFKREGRLETSAAIDLTDRVIKIMATEPNLLYLRAPIVIIADLHGQYYDAEQMLALLKKKACEPPHATFLFLGDYVDRGCFSTEILFTLFAMKISFPKRVFLLRGNHECRLLSAYYNFKKECSYKYDIEVFELITQAFKYMPLAAVVNSQYYGNYLAVHGGISPAVHTLNDIDAINRFVDIGHRGPLCDLMWADPVDDKEIERLESNDLAQWLGTTYNSNLSRGCSFMYGLKSLETFLHANKLMGIIRGHEARAEGYYQHYYNLPLWEDIEAPHYLKSPLVLTLFSAPNYCDVNNNLASIMLYEDHPFKMTTSLSPSTPYFNLCVYSHTDHPYYLPDFINGVTYSLPFVTENLANLLLFLIKMTEDVADKEDEDPEFYDMINSYVQKVKAQRKGNESKFKQRANTTESIPGNLY